MNTESKNFNFRRYEDNATHEGTWEDMVITNGKSGACPVYVHRAPPCQGSCPSGHDVRGWLAIARNQEQTRAGDPWQVKAFRKMTEANPFPAIMGRVCPAPCQEGCNRSQVEEFVGINAVEQYVGDWALENGLAFAAPETETGKSVAIVGGGPAGLAAAYFLRRKGHACTIFEEKEGLGGMAVYGIPGYRIPREVLGREIERILAMGVEVKLNTRVGTDVTVDDLERDFDAVFWGIGAQSGKALPVDGADAANCVSGVSFLRAFNQGRLKHVSGRVLVVGGGDTAMDVAAVARRIGNIDVPEGADAPKPEEVIIGQMTQDVARSAVKRGAADVWIVYRRPISKAPASEHEIEAVKAEGVEIHECLAPVEVILGDDGRATALRVIPVHWEAGKMVRHEGEEFNIEAGLIVGCTGQAGDFTGIESFDNGRGLMNSDPFRRVPGKPKHFVGGDVINPHLLTTAIDHARLAVEGIDSLVKGDTLEERPMVDVHHFNLLNALAEDGRPVELFDEEVVRGTDRAPFAVHNYEDRAHAEIVSLDQMYLGYFGTDERGRRQEIELAPDSVLDNFEERFRGYDETQAVHEGERCMSCGLCLECDHCVVYCPQDAVEYLPDSQREKGRYVVTDYHKCVGCRICADVCPTGYIQMGL